MLPGWSRQTSWGKERRLNHVDLIKGSFRDTRLGFDVPRRYVGVLKKFSSVVEGSVIEGQMDPAVVGKFKMTPLESSMASDLKKAAEIQDDVSGLHGTASLVSSLSLFWFGIFFRHNTVFLPAPFWQGCLGSEDFDPVCFPQKSACRVWALAFVQRNRCLFLERLKGLFPGYILAVSGSGS